MRPQFPTLNDPNDPEELFKYASLAAHTWTSQGLGLYWTAVHARRGNLAGLLRECPNGEWHPNFLVQPAELMLRGMALECMLKAIYLFEIQASRELTLADIGALKWWTRHDLRVMAEKAHFEFIDDNEREMVDSLTQAIRWAGRYPTPTPKDRDNWGALRPWRAYDDDPRFNTLWQRVVDRAHRWSEPGASTSAG